MRRPAISTTRAHALGWTKTSAPRSGKYARWEHSSGWVAEHCGHATATTPWALYDPAGKMHLSGAVVGPDFNPEFNVAWRTLEMAFSYVAEVLAGVTPADRRREWENAP